MPLLRRRRPLLRAAAVGGGAYAFGKHRERVQAENEQAAYEAGQQSAMAAPPPPAPSPAGATASDAISQLKQLGELHTQGILTDDEFAKEKARILSAT